MKKGRREYDPIPEAWMEWVVVPNQVAANLTDQELLNLVGMGGYKYTGPGNYFQKDPWIERGRNRTLVTQYQGYDR